MKIALSNAAMWIATGAAVIVAILVTESASPLWFMIMPTLATLGGSGKGGGRNYE